MPESKRFPIQRERFVPLHKIRRDMVRSELFRLKTSNPELIGAVYFGSETKGQAKWKSDVDVAFFIDSSVIAKEMNVKEADLFEVRRFAGMAVTPELFKKLPDHLKITSAYKLFLEDRFKGIVGKLLLPAGVHAIPVYMSSLVVKEGVQALVSRSEVFDRTESLNMFARMFHLAVGHGIRPYREMLLSELLKYGSKGRGAWRKVIETTARLEQHDKHIHGEKNPGEIHLDMKRNYPWTLERAIKVYAPKLIAEKNKYLY